MKIQRYIARDMRTALAQVRDALGPDAVILSSGRIGDDVEVVAAMDFEVARAVDAAPQLARVHAREDLMADVASGRRASSQLSGEIAPVVPVVQAAVQAAAPRATHRRRQS